MTYKSYMRIAERLRAWAGDLHPAKVRYRWLAITVVIGIIGAALFLWCRLPLPWMLGPMILCMIVALAGVPVTMPHAIRAPMMIVLGVMVGSTATPDLVMQIPQWLVPLLGLVVVMALGTATGYFYFRKVAGYDRPTAYFASVPGGLTEMILLSEANGGDARLVALSHAVRVTIAVLAVPFVVQVVGGTSIGTRPPAGLAVLELPASDLAWFVGTCLAGAFASTFVRSATGPFLAPLVISALLHGTGITAFAIPREAGIAAQLIIGLSLGARYFGMHMGTVGASMLWAIGGCVILIAVSLLVAIGFERLTGGNLLILFLAYSPAGVAEMSLVAIALNIDVAFVVLHQLSRLLLVTVLGRLVFAAMETRQP